MKILWLAVLPFAMSAQWLDLRTPGIPRLPDGKPNMKAPAPRAANGKPDLSGMWKPAKNPYSGNLIQDLKDEEIFLPEAESLYQKRIADYSRESPHSSCLPEGPHQIFGTGGPDHSLYRIIQSPNVVGLLYEGGNFRQFYLDGRKLPKDPNPTWYGYSIGHWDKDTLVVETAGFNDLSWLDEAGHPHSEDLRVTERFRRVDFGHIDFQITFEDPKVLKRPLTRSITLNYAADTDMLEYICNEGERDAVHYVGKNREAVRVGTDVLSKYVGVYQGKDGPKMNVRLVNGQLYMDVFPLVPISESRFESADSNVEFFADASGRITHLIDSAVEGDERLDRVDK